ncbi:MAG: hypothetical protein L0Y58_06655, partial [Verrucomicrobia subdivision 3 bacterium]|nr:hypothetical protein [Limisphaerales bacterium]
AKMREAREALGERLKNLTPEERKAMREQIKARFEKQLGELRGKKEKGTITPAESKRLERLERMAERFKGARDERADDQPKDR